MGAGQPNHHAHRRPTEKQVGRRLAGTKLASGGPQPQSIHHSESTDTGRGDNRNDSAHLDEAARGSRTGS